MNFRAVQLVRGIAWGALYALFAGGAIVVVGQLIMEWQAARHRAENEIMEKIDLTQVSSKEVQIRNLVGQKLACLFPPDSQILPNLSREFPMFHLSRSHEIGSEYWGLAVFDNVARKIEIIGIKGIKPAGRNSGPTPCGTNLILDNSGRQEPWETNYSGASFNLNSTGIFCSETNKKITGIQALNPNSCQ